MIRKLFFIAVYVLLGYPSLAQDVEVTISGLRNSKGHIVIGVFKDDATFQKEKAFLSKKFEKKDIVNGEMKISFSIDPGVYGITLLDDENDSGLMEYNIIGVPKEGFGFSDYYLSGLKKPKFEAFSFTLEKGQKKKTIVKVRYI